MGRRAGGLMTVLAAALVLVAGVTAADASTLTVFERNFRATWRPLTFEANGLPVRCEVTMEGSFTTTRITKTPNSRIGSVTRARVGTCSGGTAQALTETLPWSMRYSSFAGTLPSITSVTMRLVGASFSIRPTEGPRCTATTTETSPAVARAERATKGEVTGLRMEESATIPLRGEFLCELSSGRLAGTASIVEREALETAELMIMLGEEGTALVGTGSAEEAEPPIADVNIRRENTEGTAGIEDRSRSRDVTIVRVAVVGENAERFALLEGETSACRVATVLHKNRADACNVHVVYRGEVGERPRTTHVKITYRMNGETEDLIGQQFRAKAE